MGQGVGVGAVGRLGTGMGSRYGFDHRRGLEMWCPADRLGELRGELAEAEMLTVPLDESEHRRIPEGGGAAVAQNDLVSGRE